MTSMRVGPHPANQWVVSESAIDLSRSEPPLVRKVNVAAEPQHVIIDLEKTALVVVDMQNDFCAEGGYLHGCGVDCGPAQKLVEPINHLLSALRPWNVSVVWLNWAVRSDRLDIGPSMPNVHTHEKTIPAEIKAFMQNKGGWGAFDGQWGAKILDGLRVDERDIHVTKHRFSGFYATELDSILRNIGVKTLFFAGVATDICVYATLQDAMFLGYDVFLLEDCVATNSPAFCVEATNYHVRQLLGFTTKSTALVEGLQILRP
jgi:nicotinamidase-related amidase